MNDNIHNANCSFYLSREELFTDIIKIIEEIGNEEVGIWTTSEHKETLDECCRLWRNERISLKLIEALKKSLYKYYKYDLPSILSNKANEVESIYRNALNETIEAVNFSVSLN